MEDFESDIQKVNPKSYVDNLFHFWIRMRWSVFYIPLRCVPVVDEQWMKQLDEENLPWLVSNLKKKGILQKDETLCFKSWSSSLCLFFLFIATFETFSVFRSPTEVSRKGDSSHKLELLCLTHSSEEQLLEQSVQPVFIFLQVRILQI